MISFFLPLLFLLFPPEVSAQTAIGECGEGDLCALGSQAFTGFGNVLSSIIQFIFVVAVILALGFMVFGGVKWLTSGGDKDSVASARGTIIAAVVGLIVIFLAYFILNFVLLFLTGRDLSNIFVPRIGGGTGGQQSGSDTACRNGQSVSAPPGCVCQGTVDSQNICRL